MFNGWWCGWCGGGVSNGCIDWNECGGCFCDWECGFCLLGFYNLGGD